MGRARAARTVGPVGPVRAVRTFGGIVGVLFLRTLGRAERIHAAMIARGFEGRMHTLGRWSWRRRDTAFVVGTIAGAGALCVLARLW
jgi:cobalt/nickel transport system permease protein